MLYLNNKQISQLLFPIIVLGILLFFQDEIVSFMHKQLPTYKEKIANGNFNKKEISEYLNIGRDKQAYDDIFQKKEKRELSFSWITKNLLYNKNIQSKKQEKTEGNEQVWSLQAVFPKHKMAIINSKFVSEGSMVNNAKIIKIKLDRVLIKTEKGLQWVHLFH
jgi:hypothetical protein